MVVVQCGGGGWLARCTPEMAARGGTEAGDQEAIGLGIG